MVEELLEGDEVSVRKSQLYTHTHVRTHTDTHHFLGKPGIASC